MDRRAFLQAAGLSAAALAGCTAPNESPGNGTGPNGTPTTDPAPPSSLTNPSFESQLEGWTVGRDLPTDPNTGDPVETDATTTDERANDGERSLALFIDGLQDDGTLWVQQPVDLSDAETLAFDVYSPSESFNTRAKVAAYAGPGGELAEEDFDTTAAADGHEGWNTFEYDVTSAAEGIVAVGVSMVWETKLTTLLDNVRLRGGE